MTGKATLRTSTFAYDDVAQRIVSRTSRIAGTNTDLVGIDWFDQLGRPRLHQTLDTAGQSETSGADGIKVQYRYRYGFELVSNPYQTGVSTGAGAESTIGWRIKRHDQTGYSGFTTTLTDEGRVKRIFPPS